MLLIKYVCIMQKPFIRHVLAEKPGLSCFYFSHSTSGTIILKLEKEVIDLYTLSIFYDVQEELLASITHCLSDNVEEIGLYEIYFIVILRLSNGKTIMLLKFMRWCIVHLIP